MSHIAAFVEIVAGFIVTGAGLWWLAAINRRAAKADRTAWIDERIAAEHDPARRTSWRMLRRAEQEEQ